MPPLLLSCSGSELPSINRKLKEHCAQFFCLLRCEVNQCSVFGVVNQRLKHNPVHNGTNFCIFIIFFPITLFADCPSLQARENSQLLHHSIPDLRASGDWNLFQGYEQPRAPGQLRDALPIALPIARTGTISSASRSGQRYRKLCKIGV